MKQFLKVKSNDTDSSMPKQEGFNGEGVEFLQTRKRRKPVNAGSQGPSVVLSPSNDTNAAQRLLKG